MPSCELLGKPLVDRMTGDRLAPLRVRQMHIAHRRRNALVTKNALHIGQVDTGFQEIGSAAVAELMDAVDGDLRAPRDAVDTTADRSAAEAFTPATHQQRALPDRSRLLEHVVPLRQVCLETSIQNLGHGHAALSSAL